MTLKSFQRNTTDTNLGQIASKAFIKPNLTVCIINSYFCFLSLQPAFTLNAGIRIDPSVQAMNLILTLPLNYLLVNIYPRLYALHTLSDKVWIHVHLQVLLIT